jgi:hypothetical protein
MSLLDQDEYIDEPINRKYMESIGWDPMPTNGKTIYYLKRIYCKDIYMGAAFININKGNDMYYVANNYTQCCDLQNEQSLCMRHYNANKISDVIVFENIINIELTKYLER